MRALRPIHKHAQTSQVSTVTKWEIAGYAGMLEGNAARAAARRAGPRVGGRAVCLLWRRRALGGVVCVLGA